MSVTSETLLDLAALNLSSEQMSGVLKILAKSLSKEEDRKQRQAERKRQSRDSHGTVTGQVCDTPSLDNKNPSHSLKQLNSPTKENPPKGGQKKSSQTRGTRLPEDWDLPQDWGDWAETQGLTSKEIINECDKFKDYFIARAGPHAIKIDWQATWRNWVRRYCEIRAK